ncbi:MAG TPA: SDR family NAD(P)-dependent oxidoreductase [Acidimicrobiales bacterium]|nr:SDR family NAD(P)-dependent oxidoreductase [Acidimicrobiales bacterium]
MGSLDGTTAVVAGASRGIGKGIAVELGAAGAHVVVTGRTLGARVDGLPGSLEETAAEITSAGGSATPVRCDFTDDADVAALFAAVHDEHGSLDILVNSVFNAQEFGGSIGRRFWELPVDLWREVVDVGTRSAYVAAVHAAPLLLVSERGLIVNVSGRGAERYRYNVAYGVGKAALDKMTRDMAEELRDDAVAVVSIWPNVTRTENVDASSAAGNAAAQAFGDLDLLETPRYSGRAVVALAADEGVMDRTGGRFWVAELGLHYGLSDEHGRSHPVPD